MSRQKLPDSKGKVSGFAYSALWEEFGTILEPLGAKPDVVRRYEDLLSALEKRGVAPRTILTRAAISELVHSMGPQIRARNADVLAVQLYTIAAAYRLVELKELAGIGAAATKKRVRQIAKAAGALSDLLPELDLQFEVFLGLVRQRAVDQNSIPVFHLEQMATELRDLSVAASICASEIPSRSRGRSVDSLRARLMAAATSIIGDYCRQVEIEIKQSDTGGRNPRPGSSTGELLFRYLDLVEPQMGAIEKERLFAEHADSWISVTRKEIDDDEPPRKWRRRTGRLEHLRHMYPK
ncbi:hypothetical protein [Tsuneonella rigui]|uniref:hypothetical protein n=1 Tax=Tsuneonella rigui TaxID=1708790 RepID=UPI000F7F819E|nr:hypothetical protein [Tsuneonella rigui]